MKQTNTVIYQKKTERTQIPLNNSKMRTGNKKITITIRIVCFSYLKPSTTGLAGSIGIVAARVLGHPFFSGRSSLGAVESILAQKAQCMYVGSSLLCKACKARPETTRPLCHWSRLELGESPGQPSVRSRQKHSITASHRSIILPFSC